jgi:hypothetical protein
VGSLGEAVFEFGDFVVEVVHVVCLVHLPEWGARQSLQADS